MPYVRTNVVEYEYIVGKHEPTTQVNVYQRCIKYYSKLHQFIAFIDSDEYIVLADKTKTISDVFDAYKVYGAVALNTKVYGSSDHKFRPEGGVLENYNKCHKDAHTRVIVNTQVFFSVSDVTMYADFISVATNNFHVVDPARTQGLKTPFNPPSKDIPPDSLFEIMFINKYFTKSMQDWNNKIRRSKANQDQGEEAVTMDQFHAYQLGMGEEGCGYLEMPLPRVSQFVTVEAN